MRRTSPTSGTPLLLVPACNNHTVAARLRLADPFAPPSNEEARPTTMASRAASLMLRRSGVARVRTGAPSVRALLPVRGGGGHEVVPAPFVRYPAPSRPLNEEHELIWDDGVAPETCIDFDAPHMSKNEGLQWWLSGFGFFGILGAFMYFWDAPSRKRTSTRQLPFNNLAVELGADPNAASGGDDDDE